MGYQKIQIEVDDETLINLVATHIGSDPELVKDILSDTTEIKDIIFEMVVSTTIANALKIYISDIPPEPPKEKRDEEQLELDL